MITAYNAEPFIREALSSVLQQSYRDLECIVVDDGSTDDTLAVVRSFRDPRIRLIEAGRIGRGPALNQGLRRSRGEYIAIQDADDVSHPQRFEAELAALQRSPDYAGVGSGADLLVDRSPPSWNELDDVATTVHDVSDAVIYVNPLCHSSILVRRSAIHRVEGYDQTRRNLYDWDLLVRLVVAGYRIGRLPQPLVARRIHNRQFFERRNRLYYIRNAYDLQRRTRKTLGRHWTLEFVFLALYLYRLMPHSLRIGWRKALQRARAELNPRPTVTRTAAGTPSLK